MRTVRPALSTAFALALFAAPAAAETDKLPDHASPSVCVVIIGLALQFSSVSSSQADALADAAHAYRQKSSELNGGKEGADQMIGSSVAFYDELSPADLKKGAEMCLKAVGDKFEADE